MKLSKEIREKIDSYFDNISATDLLEVVKKKYGFTEFIELENQSFSTVKKSYYSANDTSFVIIEEGDYDIASFPFAA